MKITRKASDHESIAGVILWKLEISRADLGWAQGRSILVEALISLFS